MKRMKKMLSLLLVMLMVASMGVTVFAANGTGTIKVSNTTNGQEYKAYKIFDATVSSDNKIAYSIKNTDAWYSLVSAEDSPFQLTATSTSGTYNVSVKEGTEDKAVVTWLNDQTPAGSPAATGTGNGRELSLGTVDYGYYFITSSLGGVVTVSSVNPNAVVIDKNQKPGWDPDPENPDDPDTGKFVSATGIDKSYDKTSTASINDTAYFKIAANVPAYAGKTQVKDYTFTDTLGDGFTYKNDMNLTIERVTLNAGTDYTVTQNGQVITVVIHASVIQNYPSDAHVVMKYSATVDKDAVYENTNTAKMAWDYVTTPEGDEPTPPTDTKTKTYVYGFNLVKVDSETQEKLDGAKFKLLDANKKEIAVVSENGKYRVATEGETGVLIQAGNVKIFGLDHGTYYLEETKQPDGYNMLTAPYQFELKADAAYDTDGILQTPVEVENSSGTTLPETGGIGTTIFYVVGGILMVGAAVLLVTKKKMSLNGDN